MKAETVAIDAALIARFMTKVAIRSTDECWEWLGQRNQGYGYLWFSKRGVRAHRLAHRIWAGELIPGLVIDHLCRNRACVNPWHMEQVTQTENKRRGESIVGTNYRKNVCIRGHALTRIKHQRYCRECQNLRAAEARAIRAEHKAKEKRKT